MARSSSFWQGKKILVTGGAGFLGTHVVRELTAAGVKKEQLNVPRSAKCDLRRRANCRTITHGIDMVIHLAGNVGGIGKNRREPGTLFYDNIIMGVELMEAARLNKVKKFVSVGTICAYPKLTPVPFQEKDLWMGYPEETNAAYGLAKKMLLVQGQAYRQQFGFNAIYLLPVNLYGPGDKFDLDSSHVIPALIRKMLEAKQDKIPSVTVWGDGTPTREFLYVSDAARAIVLAARYYNGAEPVNIGSGKEISIKDLVQLIKKLVGYQGKIIFDPSKPNGQPRRWVDTTRAAKLFGFKATIPFDQGLRATIQWYRKQLQSI